MTASDQTPNRTWVIAALVFALNVAVVHPVFFPSLHQIGGWDESIYINEGRALVENGTMPSLARNPGVAFFYALTYLPVQSSPYWLVHSCTIGRVALFALLWWAAYLVATRLRGLASPFVMVALVAMSPALTGLLNNGTNALFAAMSGFALWQFLAFQQTRVLRHLWLTATFVGLAALSRNEGPVLFLAFVLLSLAVTVPARMVGRGLVAAVLPFVLLVGGAITVRGVTTGDFSPGTRERAYMTFEQGHGMAFAASYGSLQPYVEGQNDAPKLFGTAEENGHSILTAISRNPTAYLQRIPLLAKSAVLYAFSVYQWHFAFVIFLLAARGVLELWYRREYLQLATLFMWSGYAALYVLLCFQAAHLLIPYLTVFALAAFGVSGIAANITSRTERRAWTAVTMLLTVLIAAAFGRPNDLIAAPLLLLAGLWLMWLASDAAPTLRHSTAAASFVILPVMLTISLGVVHADPRSLGTTPDERATIYLRERFAPGTMVAAYAPGKVWSADMQPVQIVNRRDWKTDADVWAWLDREKVEAVYADADLRGFEPEAWALLEKQVGQGLEIGFAQQPSSPAAGDTVTILVRTQSRALGSSPTASTLRQ